MGEFDQKIDAILGDHPAGVTLSVQVVPGASKSEIIGLHGTSLRVRVAAPAERGKANKAVLKLLRSALGYRVDLLSGATSRIKRVLVREATQSEVRSKIASICR